MEPLLSEDSLKGRISWVTTVYSPFSRVFISWNAHKPNRLELKLKTEEKNHRNTLTGPMLKFHT